MSEEYSLRFAEYAVSRRAKGRNQAARVGLLLGYVAFSALFCVLVTVPIKIPQLIAVLPFLLLILVLVTQPLVRYDLIVRVDGGTFSVLRRSRYGTKVLVEKRVKDAQGGGAVALLPEGATVEDLRGDPDSPDGWFLLFSGTAVVFEATKQITSALRYYKPEVGQGDGILRY